MRFAAGLFALVLKFGGLGLLVLGILDSSFLFAPWGNDLLVVALTVRHPHYAHMLYYAAMSTLGSVLGCLLIDVTLRPLGEKGLEKHLSARRLKRIQSKVRDKVGRALAIASLIPPPFPFTGFVMAASALQYFPQPSFGHSGRYPNDPFHRIGTAGAAVRRENPEMVGEARRATITRCPDSYLHCGQPRVGLRMDSP